jgi:hypothetical protein
MGHIVVTPRMRRFVGDLSHHCLEVMGSVHVMDGESLIGRAWFS